LKDEDFDDIDPEELNKPTLPPLKKETVVNNATKDKEEEQHKNLEKEVKEELKEQVKEEKNFRTRKGA